MSRRSVVVIALAGLLVLSGCSGLGGGTDAGDSSGPQYDADGNSGEQPTQQAALTTGADESDAQSDPVEVDRGDRAIIREGTMTIEVDDFATAREAISDRAREMGGFVGESDERLERDGDRTRRTGYVVVRVPAEEYDAMQEAVSDEGVVVSEHTETTDVTDQLVDLEARLDNLEERRDRLRTFYERADDTEELLEIESELSGVQGEIERLEAQKRSLERQVAYSTVRVEIREPTPGESVETQYHERSLVGTFLGSVENMYVLGRAGVVTAAAVAPWLLPFTVPFLGLYWALRRGSIPLTGGSRSVSDDDGPGDLRGGDGDETGEDAEPTRHGDDGDQSDETVDENE